MGTRGDRGSREYSQQAITLEPDLMQNRAVADLTVLIPAYNEGASIESTVRSVLEQTCAPARVIVIDDCSDDDTGDVARALGVEVLRPRANTGSKAGAQNYALDRVTTRYTMALDADTTLEPNAVERLMVVLREDPSMAAACGFVVPRHVRSVWERGRYIEYMYSFTFYKQIQDYYRKPMIASGCFSMYRTEVLREHGGWGTRTLAEDMDLTWSFYQSGHTVRFVPEAVCYPIEPHDFAFLSKQLRRWSHGFVQNVSLHWKGLLQVPYLRSAVAVAIWDATIASALYLVLLPVLAIALQQPLLLLGYVIDAPALLVPVLVGAAPRKEVGRAIASLPAFFVLRTVNAMFFLMAMWSEWILGRRFTTYEKGH
jgi:poly-beta-1,6-N-acetyl-D-glucosamine synthase